MDKSIAVPSPQLSSETSPKTPYRLIKRAVIFVKETYFEKVKAAGDTNQLLSIAEKKLGLESVEESHRQHESCVALVIAALTENGISFDTVSKNSETLHQNLSDADLIVTIGGDGTFLRASHEVNNNIAIVGVNSAPGTSFGHFCCSDGAGFAAILASILSGRFQPSRLLRLNLAIDGVAITEPVLNEVLVAHRHPGGTSRYHLTVRDSTFHHKCSGLLIASPAGSTGFLRSEGGVVLPINARQFTFVERAPFLRIGETAEMKMGIVNDTDQLIVISQMQEGKLFVDGEHIEYDFPRGATLTVTAGDNDLLAYIDPDCHAPYIAESQMKGSIV